MWWISLLASLFLCHAWAENVLHKQVADTIRQAFATHELATLADLLEEDGTFCYPYPYCTSKKEAAVFLSELAEQTTDIFQHEEHFMAYAKHGQLWSSATSYFVRKPEGWWRVAVDRGMKKPKYFGQGCLLSGPEYWLWDISEEAGSSTSNALSTLRVHFDYIDRFSQAEECQFEFSKFALGSGVESFHQAHPHAVEYRDMFHFSIERWFRTLHDAKDVQENVYRQAWLDLFAEEEEAVELCDPYPSCVRGLQRVQQHVVAMASSSAVSVLHRTGPIVIAGRTAVFQAVGVDAERDRGCLSSRPQLVFLEISELKDFVLGETTDVQNFDRVHTFYDRAGHQSRRHTHCPEVQPYADPLPLPEADLPGAEADPEEFGELEEVEFSQKDGSVHVEL